jgi:hypothetical protein
MRKKRIKIGIITVLAVILGSCVDKKTEEEFESKQPVVVEDSATSKGTTNEDVTGESTHVTDLSGTLSYYPDYQMWGVRHTIPGTIDSVDLYLIKDDMKDLSTDTSLSVVFSGDYFPSKLKPSLGGLTIYIITNFKYNPL